MAIKVGFNTTSMCVFLSANTYRLYYVRYIERMKYKYMFYNRCAYIYILYICTVYRIYMHYESVVDIIQSCPVDRLFAVTSSKQ